MPEAHEAERPSEGPSPVQPEETAPPAAEPARSHRASRHWMLWLAALLALGIAGVILSPFWAPEVALLLPWDARPTVSANEFAALAARVRAIEMHPAPLSVDADAVKSSISSLSDRVDRLETAVNSRLA